MEEFKQHYKGLIDESLTCQDKVELIKKCEKYTDEVIRKDVCLKTLSIFTKTIY
ncbi:sigmaB regulation protein RsbU [Staphylococcus aureus]|nr:sigmaB regulation protein RsbU [Staphylococcus aureus]